MDHHAILQLLNRHASLGYEQIAADLDVDPDEVRLALTDLRARGLVDVLSVGELEGHITRAASYWRLTREGRKQARRGGGGLGVRP